MGRVDVQWPDDRRTERLHVRVSPEFKHLVEDAAREVGMSVSDFVVSTVRNRADDVLARRTVVPDAYYDELLAALDEPPRVVPELLSAMQRQVSADT
jgi:uncharacterized protein (DUF1778 family)